MAGPRSSARQSEPTEEALRQARLFGESIDAAAEELERTGPVPPEEVARVMAELEKEWAEESATFERRSTASSR